jgi:AcrR family transcriptional regulator
MPRISKARRAEHGESRRNQILEAALRVWVRDGFHSAPVEAIAREAGLGKGTIYLYFPNKEAVLRAAIDRFSLLPVIGESVGKLAETPPEQAIPAFVAAMWQRLKERAPVFRVMLGMGGILRPENARIFLERIVLPGNAMLAAYLDHCVERGALRPIDTFVAARALLGSLLTFVLSQEVLGGAELRPISDEAIVETVSELFLRGVRAPEASA